MSSPHSKRRVGHAPLVLAFMAIAGWLACTAVSVLFQLRSVLRAHAPAAGVRHA